MGKTIIKPVDQERYWSMEEINLMVNDLESRGRRNSSRPRRGLLQLKFLIQLSICSGARISEICGIKINDMKLNVKHPYVKVIGKGGYPRKLNLDTESFVPVVKEYLADVRPFLNKKELDYLFLSDTGSQMTNILFWKRFQTLQKKLGFEDRKGVHSLRHTSAVELLRADGNIQKVSKHLGHRNLNTTSQFYAHVTPEDLAKSNGTLMKMLNDTDSNVVNKI
jgi:site-specific recombinase XerD